MAVCRSAVHQLSKPRVAWIRLVAGHGVEGDCHAGALVQHRSRNPALPNLRQVHVLHGELLDELDLEPGQMGENLTTRGLDLLGLPTGARLLVGEAVIEVTGLRNPCQQLNDFRPGLMQAVLDPRRAGVMGIVLRGGEVRPGDALTVELPEGPFQPLQPV